LADADAAFAAAAEAFAATRCMPAWQRSSILTTLADAIAGDKEEFSRIISAEAAKPIADARREVGRAAQTLRIAAEEARRIEDRLESADWTPGNEGRRAMQRRFSIARCWASRRSTSSEPRRRTSWLSHRSGQPIILKPASQIPMTALRLGQMTVDAGWPAGAISVLPSSNEVSAAMLLADRMANRRVRKADSAAHFRARSL
jgi:glyceraldehyde-3-phosphate dehydrogenase (NADP+)